MTFSSRLSNEKQNILDEDENTLKKTKKKGNDKRSSNKLEENIKSSCAILHKDGAAQNFAIYINTNY